ncbi:PP2C family protein-serine/threonine phosphatase [Streptomyces niveiscabiei]|uniref:PP2C family protein-serine/threonine phosphatase n=1 Tax=Streptomyces niveiscabiei TaxID=164115 RepID=UPI0029AC3A37|nr:PP2C family protein-serine/threonine phosphatase [Streptomyces niveiscabiei]MDX3381589.1 PP2C family protein-serine/threonine phosphatase [Streptomyces niveiscabiei]
MFGVRRSLGWVVTPVMWGAVAVTSYQLVCPFVGGVVFCAVALHLRRELKQARYVAGVAQSVVLRPLPPRVEGLGVAAVQVSAERGASVGGDLYDVVGTEFGVRVVMGDVRGHGLAALGTVAALLGGFREAVYDEPELGGVLRRLDRTLARHLRDRATGPVGEEFVTVLLLEIGADGGVLALNCGHPWPYVITGSRVLPLSRADPLPPLGPFPLPADPAAEHGFLLPGESMVLFTDGAEDARDRRGRFFPLPYMLERAAAEHGGSPRELVTTVLTDLLRHTAGRPGDDAALLALRNARSGGSFRGAGQHLSAAPPQGASNHNEPAHP